MESNLKIAKSNSITSNLKIYKDDSIENELPQIHVSFRKHYNDKFVTFSEGFIKHRIRCNAGMYIHNDNVTILSYGEFTKGLLKKYNRNIQKQVCNTISHEIIHWWILKELNIKTCASFDNIAEKLAKYGVY